MDWRSKTWLWARCAVVVSTAALTACGGDGGGTSVDDAPAPTLPANLAFTGGLTDGVPLVISTDGLQLSVTGFSFKGTWDRAANQYTLPANETLLDLDLGQGLGTLQAGVTQTAVWGGTATTVESGTVSAQSIPLLSGAALFTDIASVTALSPDQVQLSWNGTTPPTTVDYSWNDFLDLDLPEDWQSGIQAGFGMLALGVEKVQFALDQFVFINASDAQLASSGAAGVTSNCAGGAGTRKLVWTDSNGDRAVGPGDSFTVSFSACRIDMPSGIAQVLDGKIVVSNYTENSSPFSVGGRVEFIELQQAQTDGGISVSTSGSLQLSISGN